MIAEYYRDKLSSKFLKPDCHAREARNDNSFFHDARNDCSTTLGQCKKRQRRSNLVCGLIVLIVKITMGKEKSRLLRKRSSQKTIYIDCFIRIPFKQGWNPAFSSVN